MSLRMMRAKLTMPSEQPIVVMTSKRKGLDTVSKALMVSRLVGSMEEMREKVLEEDG